MGILRRGEKVLVAERPLDKPYSGYWEFPGGKIEENESAEAALLRELREELGIFVTKTVPLFNHVHAYPDKTVSLEIWQVLAFQGEPVGLENQQIRWVSFDEIASLQLLQGNISIVDTLRARLIDNLS